MNMSYCRFENTLADLQECQEALVDGLDSLEGSELAAAKALVALCCEIADDYGESV